MNQIFSCLLALLALFSLDITYGQSDSTVSFNIQNDNGYSVPFWLVIDGKTYYSDVRKEGYINLDKTVSKSTKVHIVFGRKANPGDNTTSKINRKYRERLYPVLLTYHKKQAGTPKICYCDKGFTLQDLIDSGVKVFYVRRATKSFSVLPEPSTSCPKEPEYIVVNN